VKHRDVKEGESVEEPIITGVAGDLNEAKVTVVGVPDVPGKAAEIFTIVAKTGANIDMIVQNVSAAATGLTDISFTLPKSDGEKVVTALNSEQGAVGFEALQYDDQIGKLAVVGAGMRTSAGVSAQLFKEFVAKVSAKLETPAAELAAAVAPAPAEGESIRLLPLLLSVLRDAIVRFFRRLLGRPVAGGPQGPSA